MRPESRIVSAISFGVFCRVAPSTRAIIRSMKVSPGFAVIRMTSQSESTLVPPVTAERSPPDSRMTGADSPVTADSSTEATPSMTSPSAGISSPACTSTKSPRRSSVANTDRKSRWFVGSRMRFARVSIRVPRSASACALPRPSAIASAKLAKRTVNQSQRASWRVKPTPPRPATRSRISAPVVSTRSDQDDEHHRVPHHVPRIELVHRVPQGATHDRRVKQRMLLGGHG